MLNPISVKSKRWVSPPDLAAERVQAMQQTLNCLPLTAQVLLQRGLDPVAAPEYFAAPSLETRSWERLPGAAEAGELLAEAIRAQHLIAIIGDYDVDGITASCLMTEFIRQRGGRCQVFLPDRTADGYGLHERFVQAAIAAQARLLLTVDCGITAVAEVELARANGLQVIVTDHHEPGPDRPQADAVVDPKATGPQDLVLLAGVGVAWEVACAAAAALGEPNGERLRRHLDLVALGTVADVVPLQGRNRGLTKLGLKVINASHRLGLASLVQAAGLVPGKLTAMDLAFRLAPRLNAAGRMGDARHSFDLLLADDPNEADRLAQHLNQENSRRQALEQSLLAEAERQLAGSGGPSAALVLGGHAWPLGVLGLVASRCSEKYHRPCFIFSENEGVIKGSGRSIPGFPLHQVLQGLSPLLERWGGHEMAAGVTLRAEQLPAFRAGLQAQAGERLTDFGRAPELKLDAEADLSDLQYRLVEELGRMEPFGFGNPRPLLALRGLRLALPARVVGERHLKLRVRDTQNRTLEVIGFGLGHRREELGSDQLIDLAGHLAENVWNQTRSLQLELKDFHSAELTG